MKNKHVGFMSLWVFVSGMYTGVSLAMMRFRYLKGSPQWTFADIVLLLILSGLWMFIGMLVYRQGEL